MATCANPQCARWLVEDAPEQSVADTPLAVLIRRVTQQGGTWVNLRGVVHGVVQQEQEPT